jgi:hypothetical protein
MRECIPVDKERFDDRYLTRYLLGDLNSEEAERLDELGVADSEMALRLQQLENDLVDAYAGGAMRGPNLERFESFYLSTPLRREKVRFAQALRAATQSERVQPARRAWEWQWPLAAAAALMAVFSGWLLFENQRLRRQGEQLLADRSAAERQLNEVRGQLAARNRTIPRIIGFQMIPPRRGIGGMPSVTVPPDTDYAAVQVELESSPYRSFHAELKTIPGRESVFSSRGLAARAGGGVLSISVSIPGLLLKPGVYLLEVSGLEGERAGELISSYPFRVVLE